MQGIGHVGSVPLENDAVKVLPQDQTTPPYVGYFLQSGVAFTLASPTQESTLATLYFTATLEAGHGVVAGNYILFSDTEGDWSLYASVVSVNVNEITIDRPFDHSFPVTSTCQTVTRDMNVNGEVTPQIFAIRAGDIPADTYGINILMSCTSQPDDSLFGNIDLGENASGLCLRVCDGYGKTIDAMKNNAELAAYSDSPPSYNDKAGGGRFGVHIHIPIRRLWGVPFRLSGSGQVQAIVQDDLRGIYGLHMSFTGQYTSGEAEL